MDSGSDGGEVQKPVSISDAIRALELQIFDSQQEVPALMEPEIARTLNTFDRDFWGGGSGVEVLGRRLIRLGENQQTRIHRQIFCLSPAWN